MGERMVCVSWISARTILNVVPMMVPNHGEMGCAFAVARGVGEVDAGGEAIAV